MAILSSVTATMKLTKMNSQDPSISSSSSSSSSSSQIRPAMPTKIILPDKKPMKWSTGVAPGEYGGPPTTTKLRKYWGGEKEDPITSSELIWNNDFMPRLQKLLQDMSSHQDTATQLVSPPLQIGGGEQRRAVRESMVLKLLNLKRKRRKGRRKEKEKEKERERRKRESSDYRLSPEPSGFLNLNRAMSLDSLEVDLSASLKPTPKPAEQLNAKAIEKKEIPRRRWKLAPTKREQEKWDRATKAATGGSDVMLRETKKPCGDPEVLAAQSREQYYKLKNKLQLLTVGIGSIGFVSAYISYTPEIALSFGAGFLGSLAYIRMLGNSIDSMASTGATRVMKGAANQPRLLVPVALVMIYNRWNEIGVPQYGLMHLELIPMLVGFFSYKIATFAQAIEEALPDLGKNSEI